MPSFDVLGLVVGVIAFLLAGVAIFLNLRHHRLLKKLFFEAGHEEFGEVLLSHQRQLKRNQEGLKLMDQRIGKLETDSNFLINQVGLVKYNPFESAGGNMSFSLSLLDNNGDGLILTSLHSREGIRLYSKQIKGFGSEHTLTDEEEQAIEKARRTNN